jgi:uncharacterized protein DUF4157
MDVVGAEQQGADLERGHAAPPRRADEQHSALRRPTVERLAEAAGNRTFGRLVARMRDGEGILPSGVVHPDVESAIGAARGGGRPLDSAIGARMAPALGESFADVRVHTGDSAAALARAVSARAFTVGNEVFFAPGEYRPGTSAGDELIAHELAHVAQQRGAPNAGPLTVSQPGDALERDAEALARDVTG